MTRSLNYFILLVLAFCVRTLSAQNATLVTAGQLKRVPRTDNNPHGLLIVNWRTLLNKDIDQKTKSNY